MTALPERMILQRNEISLLSLLSTNIQVSIIARTAVIRISPSHLQPLFVNAVFVPLEYLTYSYEPDIYYLQS